VTQDLRKKIAQLLEKVDNKVLEAKISQTVEMIKNGQYDEIAKKIRNLDKNDIETKLDELSLMKPEEIQALKEKFVGNIKTDDLDKLSSQLNPEGKKFLEKIVSTFKLS